MSKWVATIGSVGDASPLHSERKRAYMTHDEYYRQALMSRNRPAILGVANMFRKRGEPEKASYLQGRAHSLGKFEVAFGADTAMIQSRLNALGANPPLTVDGISGPKTIAAIQAFQASKGIDPDGIVGPITLAALGMSETGGTSGNTAVKPSSSIIAVRGLETKSDAFKNKLVQVSNALGINPDWLATVMSFETIGTFSPSKQNIHSKATGLIQFLPSTARNLGTTIDNLKGMSDVEQLDWVYKYLAPYKGRMRNLNDTYLAVFMPSQMGKSSSAIVAERGSDVYEQNPFDREDKGYFTVGDITSAIHGVYNAGAARGRIPVGVAVAAGGGLGALAGIGLGVWYLWKRRKMKI